jgi:hypothetical protein
MKQERHILILRVESKHLGVDHDTLELHVQFLYTILRRRAIVYPQTHQNVGQECKGHSVGYAREILPN